MVVALQSLSNFTLLIIISALASCKSQLPATIDSPASISNCTGSIACTAAVMDLGELSLPPPPLPPTYLAKR